MWTLGVGQGHEILPTMITCMESPSLPYRFTHENYLSRMTSESHMVGARHTIDRSYNHRIKVCT